MISKRLGKISIYLKLAWMKSEMKFFNLKQKRISRLITIKRQIVDEAKKEAGHIVSRSKEEIEKQAREAREEIKKTGR